MGVDLPLGADVQRAELLFQTDRSRLERGHGFLRPGFAPDPGVIESAPRDAERVPDLMTQQRTESAEVGSAEGAWLDPRVTRIFDGKPDAVDGERVRAAGVASRMKRSLGRGSDEPDANPSRNLRTAVGLQRRTVAEDSCKRPRDWAPLVPQAKLAKSEQGS